MKRNFILILIAMFNIHIANAQWNSFSYIPKGGGIPMNFSYHQMSIHYFNNQGAYSPRIYHLKVTLLNDSIIKLKSRIIFSESKHYLVLSENRNGEKTTRKIYPNDTKEIEAEFDDYGFVGIPNDSCWLFRTNDDLVFTFAMIPEDFESYTTYFKKRVNNPILPVTKENVLDLVKEDEELKAEVEKDKKVKLYKIIKEFNKKYAP